MGKLIILTGAPESDRLDWTTPDLLQTFIEPIAQFALLQPQAKAPRSASTAPLLQQQQGDLSILDLAVWRSLPLQRTHVPTGFSQQHDLQFVGHFPRSADFLTTAGISSAASSSSQGLSQDDAEGESSRLLAEFYEHSLAVHHELASSQLVPPAASAGGVSTTTSSASSALPGSGEVTMAEDDDYSTTVLSADGTALALAVAVKTPAGRDHHLSDLEDIPPAAYLLSILPQTMTVTLIVGIISIAAPRTVETRFGAAKTLVEVMVGDETKSGFSVTFWLAGGGAAADDDGPGLGVLAGLRGQDVVLMQNVALNVFRGKVYGGSLRRDMTKVSLLYRGRRIGSDDVGGLYSTADLAKAGREARPQHPQLEKTKRVRDWVLKFVGGGPGVDADAGVKETGGTRKSKRRPPRRDWNQPPPLDSQ